MLAVDIEQQKRLVIDDPGRRQRIVATVHDNSRGNTRGCPSLRGDAHSTGILGIPDAHFTGDAQNFMTPVTVPLKMPCACNSYFDNAIVNFE